MKSHVLNSINKQLLSFNNDKSSYTILGNKKARKKLKEQCDKSPLVLNGEFMKETNAVKILGDFICLDLGESVHQTVMRRLGLAKHAAYELRTIVEDTRANKIGGNNIAFEIFDASIVTMVLHNCESWVSIPKKTFRALTNFFNTFYCCIFCIGSGCPISNLYWQSGSLLVEKMRSLQWHNK